MIDGTYTHKLGDLVLRAADQIVWLDLPIRTWMRRLIGRTVRRLATREELWNGNRESLRSVIGGTDSLVVHALRTHFRRRREWPATLRAFPVVRLRSAADVSDWLEALQVSGGSRRPPTATANLRVWRPAASHRLREPAAWSSTRSDMSSSPAGLTGRRQRAVQPPASRYPTFRATRPAPPLFRCRGTFLEARCQL